MASVLDPEKIAGKAPEYAAEMEANQLKKWVETAEYLNSNVENWFGADAQAKKSITAMYDVTMQFAENLRRILGKEGDVGRADGTIYGAVYEAKELLKAFGGEA